MSMMGMVTDENEDEKRMILWGTMRRVIGLSVGGCVCCSF